MLRMCCVQNHPIEETKYCGLAIQKAMSAAKFSELPNWWKMGKEKKDFANGNKIII